MFEIIKELYLKGKVTATWMSKAVIAEYITEAQKQEIMSLT